MILSREDLQRMMGGNTGVGASGGGGGGDASGYASESWVDQNYISKAFFNKLFVAHSANGDITPNDTDTVIANIEAKYGLWTQQFLSALGLSSGGGGGGGASALTDLDDVLITDPQDGEALLYDANSGMWKNGTVGGGGGGSGTVTRVAMTAPTGFVVSGSPITGSGTLALSFATGYSLPTTAKQNGWDGAVTDVDTLKGYFSSGNAKSAMKLTTVSKTVWGQTYWTSGGVPDNVTGNMTSVGSISTGSGGGSLIGFDCLELNTHGTQGANGGYIDFHYAGSSSDYTTRIIEDASGRLFLNAPNGVRIGDALLVWDMTNDALKLQKYDGSAVDVYSTGALSALGLSAGVTALDAMTFDNVTVNDQLKVGGLTATDLGSGNARLKAYTILYLGDGSNTYIDVYGYVNSKRFYVGNNRYIYLDGTTLKYYDNGTDRAISLS